MLYIAGDNISVSFKWENPLKEHKALCKAPDGVA